MNRSTRLLALLLPTALVCSGCAPLGPSSLNKQRGSYTEVIAATNQQELLANIVRLKYVEPPVFLQISSVTASPSLEYGAEAEGGIGGPNIPPPLVTILPRAVYRDEPTILYSPLRGKDFANELLTPFTARQVFQVLNNGFDFAVVADLMFASLNGYPNRRDMAQDAQREFRRLATLIAELYARGEVVYGTPQDAYTDPNADWLMALTPEAWASAEGGELRRYLDVSDDAGSIEVGPGARRETDRLSFQTRSLLSLMAYFSNYVEVPAAHRERTWPAPRASDARPPIRILSSRSRPDNAAPAIRLMDHWFFVDADDLRSRNALYLLRLLFNLQAQANRDADDLQFFLPVD